MTDKISDEIRSLGALAIEYWKLCGAFERAIALAPEGQRGRLESQARYASERLGAILGNHDMSVVDFDGRTFEVGLAAVAVNVDEFSADDVLVVERTLEPAVVIGTTPLASGRVYLRKAS
ncbi:hypothetical protein [Jiella pelagia]|uniref:Uncharacterized protein n=1 Tax=Jiella pelagia TaxID=2986949 RepID=A0ABY7C2X5_9HYPH|nr:hypothetical protein [Jiella pelagia]WAP70058.1 hypothetical protein OH818_07905 [Jiella pelagia]